MKLRPTKVVRIIGRMNIGGPAIHAVLLTEALNGEQYHSVLVAGTVGATEGDMLYFAHQYRVTPYIIPELGREISWRSDLIALWKIYRFLVRERPDIVHTHTAKAGTLGRLAAILARVPIRIHSFHGHVFHGYFSSMKARLFVCVERVLALFTTKIVAISAKQFEDLSDKYRIAPGKKFAIVPLGLELTRFLQYQGGRKMPDAEGGDQEIVIGFIGRLVPIKNPQMAVKVLENLTKSLCRDARCRLIFAGNGELMETLQADVLEAGLEHYVQFDGWRQDLAPLYAKCDVVILTSFNEGTPVALIEAMASARPFVATRVGGIRDLMTGDERVIYRTDGRALFSLFGNGVLVESSDVEGFSAALQHLLRDRNLRQCMGAEGRRFVASRFSKDRLVSDIHALYQDCLEKRPGLDTRAGHNLCLAGESHPRGK